MLPIAASNEPAATAALAGWDAIEAANGFGIAITGTLIVFTALTAISLFIGVLPKVLHALGPWLPEIESHHDAPTAGPTIGSDSKQKLAAAIAVAAHRSRGG